VVVMRLNTSLYLLLLAFFVILLSLFGCSSGASGEPPPAKVGPASAAAPASTPAPKSAPKELPPEGWRELEPGLDLGSFTSPTPSEHGDSRITVLRVDPARFALELVSASATKEKRTHTAREWAQAEGLLAAINPSMYQADHLTSTHHMQTRGHKNNPRKVRENSILVFDPKEKGLPAAQIIDRGCQDYEALAAKYETHIESIRMISSCTGENVWAQQPKRWSHALVGVDAEGRVLFIHCRSPFSTHDFVEILQALPLGLRGLQYAEGGPEAQLFVGAGGVELELFGSFETGFFESDLNTGAWPVPNVLGVVRR
jgi:hypothetical protein